MTMIATTDRLNGAPAPAVGTLCRHCGLSPVQRPRGLCWSCYYTPGVRALYPPVSNCYRRGVGNGHGGYALPEPTTAPPGPPEKVAVLEERARLRQCLWHPGDAK